MTQQHRPDDGEADREIIELTVTLDMAELDAIRMHLEAATKLLHESIERHSLELSGVAMAAEAAAQHDLREAWFYARRYNKEITPKE